jgi:uncharacterized protein
MAKAKPSRASAPFWHAMRSGCVYVDTNAFIYLLAVKPKLSNAGAALLSVSEQRELFACAGQAVHAELLVKPMRDDDAVAVGVRDGLFAQQRMLEVLPHDAQVFRLAASLRALHRLRFIDALHMATALTHRCSHFVTNDGDFVQADGITMVLLSEVI